MVASPSERTAPIRHFLHHGARPTPRSRRFPAGGHRWSPPARTAQAQHPSADLDPRASAARASVGPRNLMDVITPPSPPLCVVYPREGGTPRAILENLPLQRRRPRHNGVSLPERLHRSRRPRRTAGGVRRRDRAVVYQLRALLADMAAWRERGGRACSACRPRAQERSLAALCILRDRRSRAP